MLYIDVVYIFIVNDDSLNFFLLRTKRRLDVSGFQHAQNVRVDGRWICEASAAGNGKNELWRW